MERVRSNRNDRGIADAADQLERERRKPAMSEDKRNRAVRGADGVYMTAVQLTKSVANPSGEVPARLFYRAKPFHIEGGEYFEVRRYYAGNMQIAYAQVGKDNIKLFAIDTETVQRMHTFHNDAEVLEWLREALQEVPE